MKEQTIGVFMGAHDGANPDFKVAAQAVGRLIATNGYNLVYGGSATGLMGTVAKTAKEHGAYVIGIHPDNLIPEQAGPDLADEYIPVPDMDTRKRLMFDRADAFLFLAGGLGTLEELGQVLSWTKLGMYDKPIVLLNTDHFYDSLAQWLEHSAIEGFEDFIDINQYALISDPETAFAHLTKELAKTKHA
ncbi:hypothetical protein WOSG25_010900 [Weissella oryzae SG25]|uniref:Cytokinin riboside 5'-monophosphate phosphoribohydrolase n=1 Tax=Weissella oryzae (strain DSM 25784 / JCM 18191 / LMG 30913 / SG25) TaxID=1329250 RepID=A0A069CS08_WEIOS|nr:TIGR00730 family Rossman fold protein [Weissella oryzae]GAK30003.1 hypothetical protein WOSG25_010900 [Weissella oryzae SG25]